MLVLSRKHGQEVVVGEGADQVRVTVVEIRGDKVRLGFQGRRDLPIHRGEVAEAIARGEHSLNCRCETCEARRHAAALHVNTDIQSEGGVS